MPVQFRQPILFEAQATLGRLSRNRGVAPFMPGITPMPTASWTMTGVTKDSTGAAMASATVKLYRTDDDRMVDQTVSDGSGNYTFSVVGLGTLYYVIAYKTGAPDVTGATVNTLQAVQV